VVTVRIRQGALPDIETLADLFRRSSLSNEGDRASLLANPDALHFSGASVRQGRTRVATLADGSIGGFITVDIAGDTAEIEDLFVDPGRTRRGIARELMLDAIRIVRGRGVVRCEVTGNVHALGFYENAGFVVDHVEGTQFGQGFRMHLDV